MRAARTIPLRLIPSAVSICSVKSATACWYSAACLRLKGQKVFTSVLSGKSAMMLFHDNPFVLRLAFGYPVIQMGEQVSVGGGKFTGTGGKVSDYAVKAAATGNLALIEIKTGETPLLEKTEYRG